MPRVAEQYSVFHMVSLVTDQVDIQSSSSCRQTPDVPQMLAQRCATACYAGPALSQHQLDIYFLQLSLSLSGSFCLIYLTITLPGRYRHSIGTP